MKAGKEPKRGTTRKVPASALSKEIGLAVEFAAYTDHCETVADYLQLIERLDKWKAIAAHRAHPLAPHVWN